jgi:hypothetical protein
MLAAHERRENERKAGKCPMLRGDIKGKLNGAKYLYADVRGDVRS